MNTNHTFAVCAYKESEYLEECLQSLLNQTVKTNIVLATSTPNDFIESLCKKYDIPMYVNEGESGITQDWTFAYSKADTYYVTIAHQDDVYEKEYVECLLEEISKVKKPLIFFTDYYEIRDGIKIHSNRLLNIKRIMLFPLRTKLFWNSVFVRRRILSIGSPICCPSVTIAKNNCPEVIFKNRFRSNEDWEAWEELSKLKGAFVYSTKRLVCHRIHEDSETSKIIGDNARSLEDYAMFKKFWPDVIAKKLAKIYSASEKSNNLK